MKDKAMLNITEGVLYEWMVNSMTGLIYLYVSLNKYIKGMSVWVLPIWI